MRKQSWYTGSFATIGGSYLGYNQWALLSDPPEDMKAAVIGTGLHEMADFVWGTGALSSHMIDWADVQRRVGTGGLIGIMMLLRSLAKIMRPVYDSVPLLDAVNKHFEGKAPKWLQEALTHSDVHDDWDKPMDQSVAVDKANIPILLTAGWDDPILPNVIWQYDRLSERGCNVALTVGPWTHLQAQGRNTLPESFNWLEEHLSKRISNNRSSAVRIFVTGLKVWRDLPKWPPPTSNFELYLNIGKQLTREVPKSGDSASTFEFHPADPTPSVGVPLLFDNGPGRSEGDTRLASRSDVLVFETEVLHEDIEVCGKPAIELKHTTSSPNADLLVLLSDCHANGDYSRTISENYLRLSKDRGSGALTLSLTDCAHQFNKSKRIRLLIAGGSHPRYIRNLGTDEDPVRGEKMEIVQHTVRHDASAVSKLILPVTKIS